MLAILIFWVVLLSIFLALGEVFLLLYNRIAKNDSKASTVDTFFIGIAMGGIIACSLSIFIPLSSYVFLVILAFTAFFWVIHRKRAFHIINNAIGIFRNFSVWHKVAYIFVFYVLLFYTSCPGSTFDQFLYHQQHVKWLQEYGVVNGLANLHMRFGFNSSSLSITSLFAYHPDIKISFIALNGLCLLVFSSWLFVKFHNSSNTILKFIYVIILAIFADFYIMELSSTSTDILVNILILYLLIKSFFTKNIRELYLPLAILPAFCVTLKLSSAPIVILTLFVYYYLFKSDRRWSLYYLVGMTLLIAVPWLAQNIILTGYLFFPFPDIDIFSFDWKVPNNIVAEEKIITYNWARGTDESSFRAWFPHWWANIPFHIKSIYSLTIISSFLFIFYFRKLKGQCLLAVACITAIIGNLFGLLTAPAPRFSYGFILASIIILLFPLINYDKVFIKKALLTVQYIIIIYIAVFHIRYINFKTIQKIEFGNGYPYAQFVKPFPISLAIGKATFEIVKVGNIDIYVPDQEKCFDHKLPCTPSVKNNLELRGSTIKDGFRIKTE